MSTLIGELNLAVAGWNERSTQGERLGATCGQSPLYHSVGMERSLGIRCLNLGAEPHTDLQDRPFFLCFTGDKAIKEDMNPPS